MCCKPIKCGTKDFMSAALTDLTALQRDDFEIPKMVARSLLDMPDLNLKRNIPNDILVPLFCVFRISLEMKLWRSSKCSLDNPVSVG